MAQRKAKNKHIGGTALPLFTPESGWERLATLPDLRQHKRVALDRETKDHGLQRGLGPGWCFPEGGYVCGTSIAWHENNSIRSAYFPVRHPDTQNFDPQQITQWEIDHQKAGVTFVGQNMGYDAGWGYVEGVPIPKNVDDVLCMANMINTDRDEYDLDSICKWLGLPFGKDETLLVEALAAYGWPCKTNKQIKENLWRLPARYVGPYAEQDTVATLQLADLMDVEIDKQGVRLAYRLEMDLLPLIHEMRRRGIRVDLGAADREQKKFRSTREEALRELSDKLGQTTGIHEIRQNSWLEMTFDAEKVSYPRNENGYASFDARWMRQSPHWLPQLICKAKAAEDAAEKFIGTYILKYATQGSDPRLHASINQFRTEEGGTKTYRFSYAEPPLQQAPKRDEMDLGADEFREVFLPEKGEKWYRADANQQEIRLMVHYAVLLKLPRAEEVAQRYRDDPKTDFHKVVMEWTGLERTQAKSCSFAKSYGAGIPRFAELIGKSDAEAIEVMAKYDSELPFIPALDRWCKDFAETKHYILLIDKAKIHFNRFEPTWLSREEKARGKSGHYKMNACDLAEAKERTAQSDHPWYRKRLRRANVRKALNAKIQGSAARHTKAAMRDSWREGLVPILSIHDELCYSLTEEWQGRRVNEIMCNAVQLTLPMRVDGGWGKNWGDAVHSWEDVA
jgi:DNA polymerase I-like protein with 3'-5' exonuclease and polymerase domains